MEFDIAILIDDAIECVVTSHGVAAVEEEIGDVVTCVSTSDFADDVDVMQFLIDDAIACGRRTNDVVCMARAMGKIAALSL